jgi:hypothetical protein
MTNMTMRLRRYAGKMVLLNRDRGDERGRSGAGGRTPEGPAGGLNPIPIDRL